MFDEDKIQLAGSLGYRKVTLTYGVPLGTVIELNRDELIRYLSDVIEDIYCVRFRLPIITNYKIVKIDVEPSDFRETKIWFKVVADLHRYVISDNPDEPDRIDTEDLPEQIPV